MPVAHQRHAIVSVTVARLLRGFQKRFDFGLSQIVFLWLAHFVSYDAISILAPKLAIRSKAASAIAANSSALALTNSGSSAFANKSEAMPVRSNIASGLEFRSGNVDCISERVFKFFAICVPRF